jgi:hypothetical protein
MSKKKKEPVRCCGVNLEFVLNVGEDWQSYVPETAKCNICGTLYEKKIQNENQFVYHVYNARYVCNECDSKIIIKQIIHKNGIPEDIPHCPRCEKEPKE